MARRVNRRRGGLGDRHGLGCRRRWLQDALVLDLVAHDAGVTDIDISADGTLATVGFGEEVRLWDLDTGRLLVELQTHSPAGLATLAFSPDSSDLLYTDGDVLRRYHLDTDELVRPRPPPRHPRSHPRRMRDLPHRRLPVTSAPDPIKAVDGTPQRRSTDSHRRTRQIPVRPERLLFVQLISTRYSARLRHRYEQRCIRIGQ